jgi:putative DeoR family transcriptional regulator (stage III sporulation protein D)
MLLKMNIEERACDLAAYIIESRATVRAAARKFGISKSTVHGGVNVERWIWVVR